MRDAACQLYTTSYNTLCQLYTTSYNILCQLYTISYDTLYQLYITSYNILCHLYIPSYEILCQLFTTPHNTLCQVCTTSYNTLCKLYTLPAVLPAAVGTITAIFIVIIPQCLLCLFCSCSMTYPVNFLLILVHSYTEEMCIISCQKYIQLAIAGRNIAEYTV